MKNPIKTTNIAQFQSMCEPLTLEAAIKESNRCLLCHDAPCSAECPAGTDPGKFIRQIKFYNYKGAARTIRRNNILGSVCAFVCPVEKLCEKACSVKALEEPVNINGLQRFAVEYGKRFGIEALPKSRKTSGNVAVIGCGPAGMSCASELAKMDYAVTIFERENSGGGVPRWNIPEFRLPGDTIAYDMENLLSQGVAFKYESAVKSEDAIEKMLLNGYDAVFISTGLTEPYRLNMLDHYENAMDYITFLRRVKFDRKSIDISGKTIAVIGGGSVAVDAAVSAKACGAKKVYLVSLEHLDELPADKEEVRLAQIMNIIFKAGSQITEVLSDEKNITGLKGIETEWIEPGRFTPDNIRQIAGTEFSINADMVIQAIGTKPGREIINIKPQLQTNGKGVISVNEKFETNETGIFAGGDVVNGGATVAQAVGEGKKSARFIDEYIKNRRNSK